MRTTVLGILFKTVVLFLEMWYNDFMDNVHTYIR